MFYEVKHEGLYRATSLKGVKNLKKELKLTENVFRHNIEASFPKTLLSHPFFESGGVYFHGYMLRVVFAPAYKKATKHQITGKAPPLPQISTYILR